MFELIDGILAIGCGTYGYLAAVGKVQIGTTEETTEEWRNKYGKIFLILGPILIVFGLYRLSMYIMS